MRNLAKHGIYLPHPTLSTVGCSIGCDQVYVSLTTIKKSVFFLNRVTANRKASIQGPRNRGKFGKIHVLVVIAN